MECQDHLCHSIVDSIFHDGSQRIATRFSIYAFSVLSWPSFGQY